MPSDGHSSRQKGKYADERSVGLCIAELAIPKLNVRERYISRHEDCPVDENDSVRGHRAPDLFDSETPQLRPVQCDR